MKIELARHSGFCSGVRGAVVRIVKEISHSDEMIYIYGPLIHNPQTVEILDTRGLKTVTSLETIDNRTVAIRTHGETRDTYREIRRRAKRVINLTCPKVSRVHSIVKKYSAQDYHIIILGDRDHAEVQGIMSQADGGVTVISCTDDIATIPPAERYAVVAQTTLDMSFFNRAVEIIKGRFDDVMVINTICDATSNRQNDLINAIKKGVDAIVVVGGKNSANTRRLAGIGTEHGIRTFHIETESELDAADFRDVKHVLVSAGASTPSWIINNVLERLHHIKYANSLAPVSWLKSLVEFFVRTNLFSSILTSLLVYAIGSITGKPDLRLSLASGMFIFLMYSVNNYFQRDILKINNSYKYLLYRKFSVPMMISNACVLVAALFLASGFDQIVRNLYIAILVLGSLYSIPPVRRVVEAVPFLWMRRIYGLKSLASTLGWVFVAVCIPYISSPFDMPGLVLILSLVTAMIFVRNILLDLIAYQADLIIGVDTFPTVLGIIRTRILMYVSSFIALCVLLYSIYADGQIFRILFAGNLWFGLYLFHRIDRLQYFYSLEYEVLVDLNLFIFILFLFI